ncbi:MAG: CRISPR-associated helicase Cas3' [Clostridiales bacterium]|nr:CRISPR-associated helicase Cas3' [Clostridiales bacterium]
MNYIAHIIPESGIEQSVFAHLKGTAEKASKFAEVFGAEKAGYFCGMLHDIGKYSEIFQRRIRGSSEHADHLSAGVLEAAKLGNIPAAFCIAGHHGGLPDGGNKKTADPYDSTLCGKMKRIVGTHIEDYNAFKTELSIPESDIPNTFLTDKQSTFFFIRMLYSCLVDGDFLDTEEFMSGGAVERSSGDSIPVLLEKLNRFISPWWDAETELNEKRCDILRKLIDSANADKGLFTLTVPTGGGKTVSSMAFALNHALCRGLNRVIYVIPYTSIIEQTQSVFEDIFGKENVIAHYANVDYATDENGEIIDKRYLAAENWDAPIILTTNVQFFESLYSNRPSRCRKLHNIANSVIIFDEAQMLPLPCLKPCISAISQLVKHYGCSAVLCTATQPALNRLFEETLPQYKARELCPDVPGMYDFFRRVSYVKLGKLANSELAQRLMEENQVLCIVNSRKQAQHLFSLLDENGSYHLSTTMYPAHRRQILSEIRERLKSGENCRVVSTSLVEAGVDLDFPAVYRALAGLDSMIQAGGRCNREGKRNPKESIVYLFESEDRAPEIINQNISAAEHVMRKYKDIASPEAVKAYFDFLYYTLRGESELDNKQILKEIENSNMPFKTISEKFRIIENSDFTAYIPLGEGAKLVKTLEEFGATRKLIRKLGQYSVGVRPQHFNELVQMGAAEKLSENTVVLRDLSMYSKKTGLSLHVNSGQAFIIENERRDANVC